MAENLGKPLLLPANPTELLGQVPLQVYQSLGYGSDACDIRLCQVFFSFQFVVIGIGYTYTRAMVKVVL